MQLYNDMHADSSMITNYDTLVQQYFRSTFSYWEQIYAHTTVYSRIYQERARQAIAYLDRMNLFAGAPVLEIGCGPGIITTAMARKGFCISAIDSAPEMVERTKTKTQQAGLDAHVRAQVGNIDNLPFADAAFEVVVMIGVTEWLVSLARPLSEIYRVLRPGGHLIISADNNWPLQQLLDPLVNPALKPIKRSIGKVLRNVGLRTLQPRVRAYSLKEFDEQLSDVGLKKVTGRTLGFGPFTFCNREILSEKTGWELHLLLQRLADQGTPALQSAGLVYIVLTQKLRAT
jgi:ubiquinone/menaquinone biosynthesis C-methylase UbiE